MAWNLTLGGNENQNQEPLATVKAAQDMNVAEQPVFKQQPKNKLADPFNPIAASGVSMDDVFPKKKQPAKLSRSEEDFITHIDKMNNASPDAIKYQKQFRLNELKRNRDKVVEAAGETAEKQALAQMFMTANIDSMDNDDLQALFETCVTPLSKGLYVTPKDCLQSLCTDDWHENIKLIRQMLKGQLKTPEQEALEKWQKMTPQEHKEAAFANISGSREVQIGYSTIWNRLCDAFTVLVAASANGNSVTGYTMNPSGASDALEAEPVKKAMSNLANLTLPPKEEREQIISDVVADEQKRRAQKDPLMAYMMLTAGMSDAGAKMVLDAVKTGNLNADVYRSLSDDDKVAAGVAIQTLRGNQKIGHLFGFEIETDKEGGFWNELKLGAYSLQQALVHDLPKGMADSVYGLSEIVYTNALLDKDEYNTYWNYRADEIRMDKIMEQNIAEAKSTTALMYRGVMENADFWILMGAGAAANRAAKGAAIAREALVGVKESRLGAGTIGEKIRGLAKGTLDLTEKGLVAGKEGKIAHTQAKLYTIGNEISKLRQANETLAKGGSLTDAVMGVEDVKDSLIAANKTRIDHFNNIAVRLQNNLTMMQKKARGLAALNVAERQAFFTAKYGEYSIFMKEGYDTLTQSGVRPDMAIAASFAIGAINAPIEHFNVPLFKGDNLNPAERQILYSAAIRGCFTKGGVGYKAFVRDAVLPTVKQMGAVYITESKIEEPLQQLTISIANRYLAGCGYTDKMFSQEQFNELCSNIGKILPQKEDWQAMKNAAVEAHESSMGFAMVTPVSTLLGHHMRNSKRGLGAYTSTAGQNERKYQKRLEEYNAQKAEWERDQAMGFNYAKPVEPVKPTVQGALNLYQNWKSTGDASQLNAAVGMMNNAVDYTDDVYAISRDIQRDAIINEYLLQENGEKYADALVANATDNTEQAKNNLTLEMFDGDEQALANARANLTEFKAQKVQNVKDANPTSPMNREKMAQRVTQIIDEGGDVVGKLMNEYEGMSQKVAEMLVSIGQEQNRLSKYSPVVQAIEEFSAPAEITEENVGKLLAGYVDGSFKREGNAISAQVKIANDTYGISIDYTGADSLVDETKAIQDNSAWGTSYEQASGLKKGTWNKLTKRERLMLIRGQATRGTSNSVGGKITVTDLNGNSYSVPTKYAIRLMNGESIRGIYATMTTARHEVFHAMFGLMKANLMKEFGISEQEVDARIIKEFAASLGLGNDATIVDVEEKMAYAYQEYATGKSVSPKVGDALDKSESWISKFLSTTINVGELDNTPLKAFFDNVLSGNIGTAGQNLFAKDGYRHIDDEKAQVANKIADEREKLQKQHEAEAQAQKTEAEKTGRRWEAEEQAQLQAKQEAERIEQAKRHAEELAKAKMNEQEAKEILALQERAKKEVAKYWAQRIANSQQPVVSTRFEGEHNARCVFAFNAIWKTYAGKNLTKAEQDLLLNNYGLTQNKIRPTARLNDAEVLAVANLWNDASQCHIAEPAVTYVKNEADVELTQANEVYNPISNTFIVGSVVVDKTGDVQEVTQAVAETPVVVSQNETQAEPSGVTQEEGIAAYRAMNVMLKHIEQLGQERAELERAKQETLDKQDPESANFIQQDIDECQRRIDRVTGALEKAQNTWQLFAAENRKQANDITVAELEQERAAQTKTAQANAEITEPIDVADEDIGEFQGTIEVSPVPPFDRLKGKERAVVAFVKCNNANRTSGDIDIDRYYKWMVSRTINRMSKHLPLSGFETKLMDREVVDWRKNYMYKGEYSDGGRYQVSPTRFANILKGHDNLTTESVRQMQAVYIANYGKSWYLKAPNGEMSKLSEFQWLQVRTQSFKDWFGDWENDKGGVSGFIGEDGEPICAVHGSYYLPYANGIYENRVVGIWFSDSEAFARGWSTKNNPNDSSKAEFCYLNAKRVFEYDANGGHYSNLANPFKDGNILLDEEGNQHYAQKKTRCSGDNICQLARIAGYDGVILRNINEGTSQGAITDFIVFKSNQVKSADFNNGEFDDGNNSSRYQIIADRGLRMLGKNKNQERALKMERQGVDRLTIWQKTGMYRGVENGWRYEIPFGYDDAVSLITAVTNVISQKNDGTSVGVCTLGEAVDLLHLWNEHDHKDAFAKDKTMKRIDELFAAYPRMRELNVHTWVNLTNASGDIRFKDIRISDKSMRYNAGSTLVHELQHYIQRVEGLAEGANNIAEDYWTRAGEVEARMVAERSKMTTKERKATPPWENYDVAEDKQTLSVYDQFAKANNSRFSVSPNMAQAYYTAVKNGQEDNALNLLKHIVSSRQDVHRDSQGIPQVMYHGTDGSFNVFDPEHIGAHGRFNGSGFNFSTSEANARSYGKNVIKAFLFYNKALTNTEKTITLSQLKDIFRTHDVGLEDTLVAEWAGDSAPHGGANYERMLDRAARQVYETSETDLDIYTNLSVLASQNERLMQAFGNLGFDASAEYENDTGRLRTVVVFYPDQVKRADATRDDNGNLIPLEERFNRNSDDMRYQVVVDGVNSYKAIWMNEAFNPDGSIKTNFTRLIMSGEKKYETRKTRGIPVGEWVALATDEDGTRKAVALVRFGAPILVKRGDADFAEVYSKSYTADTYADEGWDNGKWCYEVLEVKQIEPVAVKKNNARWGTVAEDLVKQDGTVTTPQGAAMLEFVPDESKVEMDDTGNVLMEQDGNGHQRYNIVTWEQGGRQILVDYLDNAVKDGDVSASERKQILDTMDSMYNAMRDFQDKYVEFGSWSQAQVMRKSDGTPVMCVIKKNGDYAMNLDFSTLCKKRRAFDRVMREIIKRGDVDKLTLDEVDFVAINRLIREYGFEVACELCFVDSKRYRQASIAQNYANLYNNLVGTLLPKNGGYTVEFFNLSGKHSSGKRVRKQDNPLHLADEKLIEKQFKKLDEAVLAKKRDFINSRYAEMEEKAKTNATSRRAWENLCSKMPKDKRHDAAFAKQALSDSQYQKLYGGLSKFDVIAKNLKEDPSSRKFLLREDLLDSTGFVNAYKDAQAVIDLYNNMGTAKPKEILPDVQFIGGEIVKKGNEGNATLWTPESAYAVGGVRVQSFSDFMAHMAFDYMQMMGELAAKHLPAHAYTKEALFARLFGMTGLKINLSLVPAVDRSLGKEYAGLTKNENGELVYLWNEGGLNPKTNVVEQTRSFPFAEAMAIQDDERYTKNVGTIAVGISDAHIKMLLEDHRIRMVIPYHKSSLNPLVARLYNIDYYNDYTKVQNTTGAKKKQAPSFNQLLRELKSARKAAEAYLIWCDKNGCTAKFNQFAPKVKDGKCVYEKGKAYQKFYYKLLEDFTCDVGGKYCEQSAVHMDKKSFPQEWSKLIQEGLDLEDKANADLERALSGKEDDLATKIVNLLGVKKNKDGSVTRPRAAFQGLDAETVAELQAQDAEDHERESIAPQVDLRRLGFSDEDILQIAATGRIATSRKGKDAVSVEDIYKAYRKLNRTDTDEVLRANAQEIYNRSVQGAQDAGEYIRRGVTDGALYRRLAEISPSLVGKFGTAVDTVIERGARIGREQEQIEQTIRNRQVQVIKDAVANELGVTAAILESEFGFDLTDTLLNLWEIPAPRPYVKHDFKSRNENGEDAELEELERIDSEIQVLEQEEEERNISNEEYRNKILKVIEGILARMPERSRKIQEQAMREEQAEDESAQESFEDAETSSATEDTIAVQEFKKQGIRLRNPQAFADFVIELVQKTWNRNHGNADEYIPWDNPVALQALRKTAQSVLYKLSNAMTYSRSRESAMRHISKLDKVPTYAGMKTIIEQACETIYNNRINLSRRQACKAIADYIDKNLGGLGEVNEQTETIKRKVSLETQRIGKLIKEVMGWGEGKVAKRLTDLLREAQAIVDDYTKQGKDASSDKKFNEINRKIKVIENFGGLVHKSLGSISDAFEKVKEIDDRADIFALIENRDKVTKNRSDILAKAFTNTNRKLNKDEKGHRWDDYFASHLDFISMLRDLSRYSNPNEMVEWYDPETKTIQMRALGDCVADITEDLMLNVQKCGDRATTELTKGMNEFYNAVENIYHGKKFADVVSELQKEDARFNKFIRKGDADRTMATKGRAMQLLVSLVQKNYEHNVIVNKREGQAQEIENLLTPEDLNLISWMRSWYDNNRESLSEISFRMFGLRILAEDINYMPVKVKVGEKGLEGLTGRVWSPFPASLTPRVRHALDFDTTADILDIFVDRMSEAAQWKNHAELGLQMRGILGRENLRESIIASHGRNYDNRIQMAITDILIGRGAIDRSADSVDNGLNAIRGWAALFALGGNVSVTLKQTTSIPAFAFEIGHAKTLAAMCTAWTPEGIEAMKRIFTSEQRKNRWQVGNTDEVMTALSQARNGKTSLLKKLMQASMITNKLGDVVPALVVGQAIYREKIAKGWSEENAMAYTWALIERTQQSGRMENLSTAQRRNRIARALYQFLSTQRQYIAYQIVDVRKFAARPDMNNFLKLAGTSVNNFAILPAAYFFMGELFKWLLGNEPDDDMLANAVASCLTGANGSLFALGFLDASVTNALVDHYINGKKFNLRMEKSPLPAIDFALNFLSKSGRLVSGMLEDDENKWSNAGENTLKMIESLNAPFRHAVQLYENRIKNDD